MEDKKSINDHCLRSELSETVMSETGLNDEEGLLTPPADWGNA